MVKTRSSGHFKSREEAGGVLYHILGHLLGTSIGIMNLQTRLITKRHAELLLR
jgi:hypothetical protein